MEILTKGIFGLRCKDDGDESDDDDVAVDVLVVKALVLMH